MYASKRRQRNFKRVREPNKPEGPTNPSKRHRERLNGELETVAGLLPFDENTLQRLDKLSVLRLAVSFLQIKAHFSVCSNQFNQCPCHHHPYAPPGFQLGPVPTILDGRGIAFVDPTEPSFSSVALRALGGFIIILDEQGDILYVSENIEMYLGFLQSDVLHQPLFEMIHSEDRDDIKLGLKPEGNGNRDLTERVMVARFRSLLDNTCGFIRVELRGRFTDIHTSNALKATTRCFVSVATPFVPPYEEGTDQQGPILKSKHTMDMKVLNMDSKMAQILELPEAQIVNSNLYQFIHPDDVQYAAEAHLAAIKSTSSGLMIYRFVGKVTGRIIYVQTSLRINFKSHKADGILASHRTLTEVDGLALLEKRDKMKPTYLTFEDTLLQSPRQINPLANRDPKPKPTVSPTLIRPSSFSNLSLSMLPPQKPFAANNSFIPPQFLQLPIENRPIDDCNNLAVMFPNYFTSSMTEREVFWHQDLKAPLDVSYNELMPNYNNVQGHPVIPRPPPTVEASMPNPPLPSAYYNIENISHPELVSYEQSLDSVDYHQHRICPPIHIDPGLNNNIMGPEYVQTTNNFNFFTEVAHTLLGNTT